MHKRRKYENTTYRSCLLARTTFDFEAAAAIYKGIIEDTKKIGGVCWDFTEDLIFEPDQAVAAAKQLAAKGADAVAVISGTFHLGHWH
jgi:hypothetical protein